MHVLYYRMSRLNHNAYNKQKINVVVSLWLVLACTSNPMVSMRSNESRPLVKLMTWANRDEYVCETNDDESCGVLSTTDDWHQRSRMKNKPG